ncbi:unnamed protein product [marine sediment metagenome]|uniref:Uncharacterized protein n=1 Tax=marine sediment metagenome TaxID=412755 RepID=X0S1D4_9ZZZZ
MQNSNGGNSTEQDIPKHTGRREWKEEVKCYAYQGKRDSNTQIDKAISLFKYSGALIGFHQVMKSYY